MAKKGEPTGVDRVVRNAEARKRVMARWETIRQKRARGAGMQGLIGTWGEGPGRKDSKCRTGGGVRWDGSLFG